METGSKLFLASANFLSHLICQPPGIHTDSKRQVSTAVWPSVFSPPSLLGSCRPPSRSLSMTSSNAVPSLEPCWNPLPGWGQSLPPLFPGPCVPDSPERYLLSSKGASHLRTRAGLMVNLSPGGDLAQTRYLRVCRMNGQMTLRDHLQLGKLLVDHFCSWSECHRKGSGA